MSLAVTHSWLPWRQGERATFRSEFFVELHVYGDDLMILEDFHFLVIQKKRVLWPGCLRTSIFTDCWLCCTSVFTSKELELGFHPDLGSPPCPKAGSGGGARGSAPWVHSGPCGRVRRAALCAWVCVWSHGFGLPTRPPWLPHRPGWVMRGTADTRQQKPGTGTRPRWYFSLRFYFQHLWGRLGCWSAGQRPRTGHTIYHRHQKQGTNYLKTLSFCKRQNKYFYFCNSFTLKLQTPELNEGFGLLLISCLRDSHGNHEKPEPWARLSTHLRTCQKHFILSPNLWNKLLQVQRGLIADFSVPPCHYVPSSHFGAVIAGRKLGCSATAAYHSCTPPPSDNHSLGGRFRDFSPI